MACLTLSITPLLSASLAVTAPSLPSASVTPARPASVAVTVPPQASVAVTPVPSGAVSVAPITPAKVAIGEVCTIGSGTLVVLAASYGPLRLKNGGYILLNPATNPPES